MLAQQMYDPYVVWRQAKAEQLWGRNAFRRSLERKTTGTWHYVDVALHDVPARTEDSGPPLAKEGF